MTYKLFLDDIRDVNMVYKKLTNDDFIVVRNSHDFKKVILEKGLSELISFNNDLGLDENDQVAEDGYVCAKWLVYESGIDLKNLKFNVHSANPVASKQILGLLDNYINHLKD
ncbi:cyclic-phosphate processing receiver domain-containing protein [Flavobacterium soyae]|uniref:Cyclic-phosphate processing receiver domain-containing protein n=1 Tax=Flavobacterium soyae TaxID=2903098 RepID=A0ABZ2U9M7_9FLAO